MNFSTKLLLIAVYFLILIVSPANAQSGCSAPIHMITAHYAEGCFMGDVYVQDQFRNPNPQNNHLVFDGHLYRVELMIILDGDNFQWNEPLMVQFIFPDGGRLTKTINDEMFPLYPNKFYNFSIDLKTIKKGNVNIELYSAYGPGEDGVRFYGTSVCLR